MVRRTGRGSRAQPELGGCSLDNNIVIAVDNALEGIHDKLHEIIHIWVLGDKLGSILPEAHETIVGLGSLEVEVGSDADRTVRGGTEGVATRTAVHSLLECRGKALLVAIADSIDMHPSSLVAGLDTIHGPGSTKDLALDRNMGVLDVTAEIG